MQLKSKCGSIIQISKARVFFLFNKTSLPVNNKSVNISVDEPYSPERVPKNLSLKRFKETIPQKLHNSTIL